MAGIVDDTAIGLAHCRSALDRDGAVPISNLFDSNEISAVREWLRAVVQGIDTAHSPFEPEFERAAGHDTTVRKLRRLFWNDEPFWRDIFRATHLPVIASALVGAPVALTFHAAFLKPAMVGSFVALHQDQALWQYDYPGAINVWIAVTPARRNNGCLIGCRGSHRRGALSHHEIPEHPWHRGVDWIAEGLEKPIPYEFEPGDALIWDRYFVHGSSANLSDSPRWGVVMAFVDRTDPKLQSTDRADF